MPSDAIRTLTEMPLYNVLVLKTHSMQNLTYRAKTKAGPTPGGMSSSPLKGLKPRGCDVPLYPHQAQSDTPQDQAPSTYLANYKPVISIH
jgi:hypothetical protein